MSAWEFHEWLAYDRAFPFGDERADWRMGTLAAMIGNVNRGRGKPAFQAKDFMLKAPETKAQKEAGLKGALRKAGTSKSKKGTR